MTYFLGCDVSKAKLDISLVNAQNVEQWVSKVANDEIAIATILLTIRGAYPGDELVCVVEATGILHLALAETSHALGIACRVYNPILTKQGIKASIRGKKTDRTDALIIARMGIRGEGRLYVPEPYRATKYYARGQQKLNEVATSLKRYETHLTTILDGELTLAAQEMMIGIQTQLKAARVQFVTDTATSAPAGLMELLRSIPGVGPFIAASLIGEIQDMARFGSTKALTAYVGFDPKVRQSGHSLNSTGHISKRGSPHLRRSLFIAANVARRYDPTLQAIYEKKRSEGKSYTVATCVVARKLIAIIRAVWLRQTPYERVFDTIVEN